MANGLQKNTASVTSNSLKVRGSRRDTCTSAPFVENERRGMMDETGSFMSQLCSGAASDSHWCIRIWRTRRRRSAAENPPPPPTFFVGCEWPPDCFRSGGRNAAFPSVPLPNNCHERTHAVGSAVDIHLIHCVNEGAALFSNIHQKYWEAASNREELDPLEVIWIGNVIKCCGL